MKIKSLLFETIGKIRSIGIGFRLLFIFSIVVSGGFIGGYAKEGEPRHEEKETRLKKETESLIKEVLDRKAKKAQLEEKAKQEQKKAKRKIGSKARQTETLYCQGENFFKKGKYQQALARFQEVFAILPTYKHAAHYVQLCKERIKKQEKEKELRKLQNRRAAYSKELVVLKDELSLLEKELARLKRKGVFLKGKEKQSQQRSLQIQEKELDREEETKRMPMVERGKRAVSSKGRKARFAFSKEAPPMDYFIGEDDILEVFIWQAVESGKYHIEAGDILEIFVWKYSDLSREIVVRPDGKISYALAGSIKIAGLTIEELEKEMTKRFSDFIKDPQVSISLIKSREADIVKYTIAGPYGSTYFPVEVKVRPDGKLSYPFVGTVKASGLTIEKLERKFEKRISSTMRNLRVSILLKESAGKSVIILGAVRAPGLHKHKGSMSLTDVIARAGGFTDRAYRSGVIVIRGDINREPKMVRIDVGSIYAKGKLKNDIAILPGDIIFAPRSFIGNLNYVLGLLRPSVESAKDYYYLRGEEDDR